MDKLEKYRTFIKQLITEHAELCPSTDRCPIDF